MTFDLNRLAFASPATESDEKRAADLPKECVFKINCLAQFVGQQLQTPGKMSKEVFEKLYRIYHDEFYAKEGIYSDECRKKFRDEISRLNPLETEVQLTRIFMQLLAKEGKLKEFNKNPQQNLVNFVASLGIKLEHWGYANTPDGLKQLVPLSISGLAQPALPVDAPILKLLLSEQRLAREGLAPLTYWQEHGFEYDWLGEDAAARALTVKKITNQRLHFRREQAIFDNILAKDAASEKSRDSASPSGLGLGGQPSSKSSTKDTAAKPSSPFETLLSGVFKALGLGEGKLQDEKTGRLTFKGLFTLMVTGITQILTMFGTFMNNADQAYKDNNPGRPLESDEIKDQQDELFNKYVGQFSKEHENIRERLTRNWRLAITPDAKIQGLEALKEALLETGNTEAFDKLRFEGYLAKIKNPAARDFFRRQKLDKTRGWNLLSQHLMREESYSEVDEILQEKALSQLQGLSENPEFQDGDMVDAYQDAFERLNLEATALATKNKTYQREHCQIRQGILNLMAQVELELKNCNKALKESEKAKKEFQDRLNVDTQQYTQSLAAIPADAADAKALREKIEAEFKAKKAAIEKGIAEQQARIEHLSNAKIAYKDQIAEKLRGDLAEFIPSKSDRERAESASAEVKASKEGASKASAAPHSRPFFMSQGARDASSGFSRSAGPAKASEKGERASAAAASDEAENPSARRKSKAAATA